MKRCISILFLSCLVLPLVGTYVYLEVQKKKVKREVKWEMIVGLEKEELVLLSFHKEDIHTVLEWKHSKEFKYREEMYDITSTEISGDSIHYWCWWDHEETKLNKRLSTLVVDFIGNKPMNKEKQNNATSFYKKLFCATANGEKPYFTEEHKQQYYYTEVLPYWYSNPISPPPEAVV